MISNEQIENILSRIPDGPIPNFPQSLLFSTFVDPYGPALVFVAHMYFTANLSGQERDPTEQMKWLRSVTYTSGLVKEIQRIRNKMAHGAFLEGKTLKKFVLELVKFHQKETQARQLVDYLFEKTLLMLESITNHPYDKPPAESQPVLEENRKIISMTIYEPGDVQSLIAGHTYWVDDIRKSQMRREIKGRTFLVLDGKYRNKKAIFRSWSGTSFYAEFLPGELVPQDAPRKTLRHQLLILLLS